MTGPLFGDAQLAAAFAVLGNPTTPILGMTEQQLLQQILVTVANRVGGGGPVTFPAITGDPYGNEALAAALDAKADEPAATTLPYASTVVLDFAGADFQTVTLTGDIEFTTSNLAPGRSKTIRIIGDSSERAFDFPAGWTFVGAAAPTISTADRDAILTMTSFGATDADVVAAYAAAP